MLTPVALADEVVAADVTRPPHQTTKGLGYAIDTARDGSAVVWHAGENRGWAAVFVTLPERREGIVILTNSNRGFDFHELALDAWDKWLGIQSAAAARPPQPNHTTRNTAVLAVAGLLVLTAILGGGYLLRRHHAKRRA